ncbi:hypothetical protein [Sandaracinus amylolyticus]|uniref:Uncharacterized protein n=1 Tax=Sandaracinus amylolyticus TaxID=927083 RepID=A0A0F6YMH9_9BACT|nr:hypothetical protein [Sandaracinus amylolyticus]AKF11053.1 hypothetical protein DB32_008202 [Sandaracinus amylolyticus]
MTDVSSAAVWIEPVMLACIEDRRFFEELAPEPRAMVTLWAMRAEVQRRGLAHFVDDVPDWIVKDVPRAAEALGEHALKDAFASLLPALKRGRAARFSGKGVEWSAHAGIEPLVASLGDALVARVIASKRAFGAVRARAETIHAEARAAHKREAEAVQESAKAKVRSRFDGLREKARPWSMQTRFAVEDAVSHAKFGVGRVRALVPPNKIEVEFEDGSIRTMLHAAQ